MNDATRIAEPTNRARRPRADDAVRIDDVCCRFEAIWRAGGLPRIESFLDAVNGQNRTTLLFELLSLELELRSESGDEPLVTDYRDRFPESLDIVEDAFGKWFQQGPPVKSTNSAVAGLSSSAGPDLGRVRRVGEYELVEELARGGMGVVYKARHLSLNRMVALKMILSGPFASEAEVRRFRVEVEAAARLDHPHIVPIFEVGRHQGHAFYTMKLIEGNDLGRHLGRFVGDPRGSAILMVALAQAVHHAHRRGLIHRDLKPSNILIDPTGQPHITDFGLAKRADAEASSLTASGTVLGTPSYMAPEQAVGGQVGPAADVYSLGAILYQLLTGRPPFRAPTVAETIAQLIEQEPIPPRRIRPEVPVELECICLKCLEKKAEHRYPSATALTADLERFLRGDGIHARRSGPLRRLGAGLAASRGSPAGSSVNR